MHIFETILPSGQTIRVSGITPELARENLCRRVEQLTGALLVSRTGDRASFDLPEPSVATFSETPPSGEFTAVCFRTRDGRIECHPVCHCADPGRCTCGHTHTSFSEKRDMLTTKPRRGRKFADDAGASDPEQLRQQLIDLITNADGDLLQRLASTISDNFDEADFQAGLGDGATSNLPSGENVSFRDRSPAAMKAAESRIKKYCEQTMFAGTPEKFSEGERQRQVSSILDLWQRSGQPLEQFLPRPF